MEEEKQEGASVPVVIDKRASTEMQRERAEEQRALTAGEDRNSTGALVRLAMERNLDVAVLEKLLALKREEEAEQARRAFVEAFAAFHAEAPTITKDKSVGYNTKDGDFVGYKHASIGNVIETVGPVLGRHGFGWNWRREPHGDKGMMLVTCRLTHKLGHFEESALPAAPDTSGKKNPIQQLASAVTYMQRYTFLLVTGLATRDMPDDDGKSSGGKPSGSELPHKAAETIEAFGRYLGEANARGDLETHLGVPAPEWDDNCYKTLRAMWPLIKAGEADIMATIEGRRHEREASDE